MEDFKFGLLAIAQQIGFSVRALAHHPLLWGFAIGFGASTLIHAFIVADDVRQVPLMLKKSAAESFEQITSRDPSGTYLRSYQTYRQQYDRVRLTFYSTFLAFLVVIAIALLRT